MAGKTANVELNPKQLTIILVVMSVAFLGFNSFSKIEPNEQGVVLRLGKYKETLEPGPHFVVPLVDRVYVVETEVIHKVEFGYRSQDSSDRTTYRKGILKESLMVTGDLNMAEVEWSVQYKIEEPFKYLFKVRDPIETLRDLSRSVMSQVVGDRSVYEALTVGRNSIEIESRDSLQKAINEYDMGLKLVALKLQNVLPPDSVKPSYNEVNEAEQYRERLVNEAQRERNSLVPKARGEAKQRLEQSEGYRIDRVNRAKGEAERFITVYNEYTKAKDVTRKRMYLETMNEVLQGMDSVILVDEKQTGVLPLLNLTGTSKGGK